VSASRFFVAGIFAIGDAVDLAADEARKLLVVLRARAGDAVEVVDSSGRVYRALLHVEDKRVTALLERELTAPPALKLRVTLAQGVPKGQKMDYVIEKATELGIARIMPFTSARSAGERTRDGKVERWRRIARSAAQQCGRSDVPEVADPVDFAALVAQVGRHDLTLVPWELAKAQPLRERIPALIEGAATALLGIGPEGGLEDAEARTLETAGAHLVSLGSRILRTETAGLVAYAALLYASGDI
jgi:16S rRNA (uracil1498-N3)-methyltransferase